LTKASLYVYFGPVAILVVAVLTCRRFDHTPHKIIRFSIPYIQIADINLTLCLKFNGTSSVYVRQTIIHFMLCY